jgi:hypothetical protein
MQQFFRDNKAYWGGLHRELGLLIYDPRDQQRLTPDKVRLYVVAERRRATFMKAIVRTGLVPSRLETWWCPHHSVVMQQHHNARGTWYSHQVTDGTWCTGQAKATSTEATTPPCTTSHEGEMHESI